MFLCSGVPLNIRCSRRCAIPVSPYSSFREPTRYVTLTVAVGFVGSGKRRTWRPFGSRYSVIPSTEVTGTSFAGGATFLPAAAGFADFAAGFVAGAGAATAAHAVNRTTARKGSLDFMNGTSSVSVRTRIVRVLFPKQ